MLASGVIPWGSAPDQTSATHTQFLDPPGVVVSGNIDEELRTKDGSLTVAVAAGSIPFPVLLSYRESGMTGSTGLPQGYLATARIFDLLASPVGSADGPVRFQPMLAIGVGIGPEERALAEDDYSRFALLHYLQGERSWEALETVADPSASRVVAFTTSLSRFVLAVRPAANAATPTSRPLPTAANPAEPTLAVDPTTNPTATLPTPLVAVTTVNPTPTNTALPTPTSVPTPITTPIARPLAIPTPTSTPTAIPTPTPTVIPTPTPTVVPTPTPTPTVVPTPTPTPTAVPTHPRQRPRLYQHPRRLHYPHQHRHLRPCQHRRLLSYPRNRRHLRPRQCRQPRLSQLRRLLPYRRKRRHLRPRPHRPRTSPEAGSRFTPIAMGTSRS